MSYNDDYGGERRQNERRDDYEGGRGGNYDGERRQERRDDYDAGGGSYGRQEGGYGRQDGGYSGGSNFGPGRPTNDPEYGGGGSSGGNYYDTSQKYGDEPSGRRQEGGGYSSGGGGGGGGYGGQQSSGTSYGGGGGYGGGNLDSSSALSAANEHSGRSREDNIFATVFDNLMGKQQQLQNDDVDEEGAVKAHQQMYGASGGEQAGDKSMGAAAAMQALKMFTGGQGGGSSSAGGQSQFVGVAMAQAAKLFDQQSANGNTHSNASKEGAIQQAAEMALKMYMKSEMSGGGASSGGGGLLSLASKFLK